MMAAITSWMQERSARERVMLSIMVALAMVIGGWLLVYRPVESALRDARETQVRALIRHERVRVAAAALGADRQGAGAKQGTGQGARVAVPLDQMISQSAGEAGFSLSQITRQGDTRVQIALATVRPGALLIWLSELEARGVMADTVTLSPSEQTGTISAQIVLRRVEGA